MTITKCAVGVHTAHDSGDGQTIYHCPFCGSGQVLARSDRTIECEFCHTAFTVQVQPEFSAFPQTVNGMPMEVPGMPGQMDPMGGAPVDPNAIGDDGSMMDPGDPMAADAEATDGDEEGEAEQGEEPANPFVSSLHRTAHGAWLDEDNYLYHLAIQNSPDPKATAAAVKASRKQASNDDLPAHLQEDWGNKTVDPRDKPHFCLQQSKKTPSIPWHNTVMKYDNGVPQHQECLGCRKKFPVNTEKDGWGPATAAVVKASRKQA